MSSVVQGGKMAIYTVDEVAEKLNVSVKTVRRYIYSGKIKASKIGNQWRIDEVQLDEYLQQSSNEHICQPAVSGDDFCVFMDTDYFSSEDKLQLCTIVDFYVSGVDEIQEMTMIISKYVTEFGVHGDQAKYNYVYDQALNRARFVLWGSANFISQVTKALTKFEGGSNA